MTGHQMRWIMVLLVAGGLSSCLDNSRNDPGLSMLTGQFRCLCEAGAATADPPYTIMPDSTYLRDIQLTESDQLNAALAVDGVTCDVNCYHIRTDSTYIIRLDAPHRMYRLTLYTLLDSLVESDIYPGFASTICRGRKL